MNLNISGIYKIENITTGKFYIGSAVNFRRRFYVHRSRLNRNVHDNPKLQAAWNFYGEKDFSFIVLEKCDINELIIKEQGWFDWLNPFDNGYNILKIAGNSLGYKHTEEYKALRSWLYKGRKLSEETRLKQSLALKGKPKTKEHAEKIKLGKSFISEETRAKIGKAHKGKTLSVAHRKIISNAQKGNKHSVGRKHTDETKLKMSISKNKLYKRKKDMDIKELKLYGTQIIIGE